MTITTLTINSIAYTSYASLAQADARLAVDPVRGTAWTALTDPQKEANLVAATNRLDLLPWVGSKTGAEDTQANAWPRTGVTYKDGTSVSTSEVPQQVEDATILVAGDITLNASAADAGSSGSNTKRVKAGSAEVEFFRPTIPGAQLQNEGAFKLIQCFLSSSSGLFGVATGTDGTSSFCDVDAPGLTEGFQ